MLQCISQALPMVIKCRIMLLLKADFLFVLVQSLRICKIRSVSKILWTIRFMSDVLFFRWEVALVLGVTLNKQRNILSY
jgi:hypothetical protein